MDSPQGAEEPGVKRNPIMVIWAVAAIAAVLAYLGNPDRLLAAAARIIDDAVTQLWALVGQFDLLRPGLLRALAIGLFVAFILLAVLAIRQGKKGRLALLLVTLGFIWSIRGDDGWLAALALSGTAAAVMTARVAESRAVARPRI